MKNGESFMNAMPTPEAVRLTNIREGLETPLSRFGTGHVLRLAAYGDEDFSFEAESARVRQITRTQDAARSIGAPALRLETLL